jgi:hypothetical protein
MKMKSEKSPLERGAALAVSGTLAAARCFDVSKHVFIIRFFLSDNFAPATCGDS